jgi:predicted Zn-dependent protease with MMP-like domain
MVDVPPERFEELVVAALDDLPEFFAEKLDNVDIVVEDWPSAELLEPFRGEHTTLFGLYQGVPHTERGRGYTFVMPDKITIFRGPITRRCGSEAEVAEQVKHTVIHEIAHHFGISDDRLRELGAY